MILVTILAIIDLKRQQNLAKEYAYKKLNHAVSQDKISNDWDLPESLLGTNPRIIDTDYTFKQWVVTFFVEDKGFIQLFVKPSNHFIVPVFNFKDDFEVDHVNFESSGKNANKALHSDMDSVALHPRR